MWRWSHRWLWRLFLMLKRVDISWDFRKLGNWWANQSRDQTKQFTLAGFSILEGSKYQLSWTGEKLVISSWRPGQGRWWMVQHGRLPSLQQPLPAQPSRVYIAQRSHSSRWRWHVFLEKQEPEGDIMERMGRNSQKTGLRFWFSSVEFSFGSLEVFKKWGEHLLGKKLKKAVRWILRFLDILQASIP